MAHDPCIVDKLTQAREELVGGSHPFLFFKSATIWQVVKLLAVVQSLLQTNNGGKYE